MDNKSFIKSLLISRNLKLADYAKCLNISQSSLSRKLRLNQFSLNDLLILSELLEIKLCFVDSKNNILHKF